MGKEVAIIGAGTSGLLACKYVLSKGFQPIVFESRSGVGGLWTKTIETTKLQTPKPFYQFSDFPWDSSVEEMFPDQHQVLDYMESYARHFDLVKHIKFNTVVRSLEYDTSDQDMQHWALWGGDGEACGSRGKWNLVVQEQTKAVDEVRNLGSESQIWGLGLESETGPRVLVQVWDPGPRPGLGSGLGLCPGLGLRSKSRFRVWAGIRVYTVDFVILCIGRFSDLPNIPDFPSKKGPDVFHGQVIHSKDYAAMDFKAATEFVKAKQVTVVGFQKSALDIAMECSTVNGVENPCTVLYRTEHWNIPDFTPWGFPLANLYLNRFSELLVHKPGEGFLLGLLATLLSPMLAVIGYSEGLSNLFTSEMRCRWLSELLDRTFKLPNIKEMEEDVGKWDEYMKRYSGQYYRRSCVAAIQIWYNDQLCKDMGDGPWDLMQKFDDFIPSRAFDNCQFVNFTKIMVKDIPISYKETEFALEALMEIPSQYKATMELQLLGRSRGRGSSEPRKVPLAPLINYNIPAPSSSPNNEFMMRSSSMNMKQQQRATAFQFSRSSSAIFSQYNMVITFSHFFLESKNSNIALRAAFHLNPSYQPSRSCMESSVHHNSLHRVLAYTTPLANHSKEKPEIIRAQTGSAMRLGVVGGSTYKTIVSLTQSHQTRFLTISTQKESMADDSLKKAAKQLQSKPPVVAVKVNTVLGSNAPSLTVKLVRASKSGSKDGSVIESQTRPRELKLPIQFRRWSKTLSTPTKLPSFPNHIVRVAVAMGKEVAIIGAGVSGLLACKYVLSKGFQPIVFESRSGVGGLWTKTIETTKLQTPKPLYQFSDFPWGSSVEEMFPDQHQVLDYIESYAHHFDLVKHIKFNSVVRSLEYDASDQDMQHWALWGGDGEACGSRGKWNLVVQQNTEADDQVYRVDFVILCIGRFSNVPNIPEFPPDHGPNVFHGQVIHSKDYAAMDSKAAAEFVKDKQVTIVGFQKSALDIAMECSTVNANLYLNRFSELLVHKPGEGCILGLLATLLSPVKEAFSKFVESGIKHKLPLEKHGMVPRNSFHQQINTCLVATVPEKFYDRVEEGSIILKKASTFGFCKEGVLVDGETNPRNTDVVILATGYKGDQNLKHIFTSPAFQGYIVGDPNASLPLYRECVHPKIPQLAVIGFSESVSNLYTSEMRCRWVSELIDGTFKLPSIKEMEEDVGKWDEYKRRYSGQYYRRSCIGAIHVWYNDQLCKDMGWNPKRKKGFFAELFEPYGPMDYVSP
ncbi:hypothetical protein F8388_007200 [Cannabis sativa]|uniref:Flavin-containing monooxygenase n=1 Tax=Cannabis sativa TaxID=3483 RepID=A0A7J6EH43_CANSA|nr:hypothetical protein F8388_007200 [Cannabis sativa]